MDAATIATTPNIRNNVDNVVNGVRAADATARRERQSSSMDRKNKRSLIGEIDTMGGVVPPATSKSADAKGDGWWGKVASYFGPAKPDSAFASASRGGPFTNGNLREPATRLSMNSKAAQERASREREMAAASAQASYRRGSYPYSGDPANRNLFAMSLNDIIKNKPLIGMMYVIKFVRMFVIAGALYLASKTFQSRYVSTVFVRNENPPNLMSFVFIYVILDAVFMSLVIFIIFLLSKTVEADESMLSVAPGTLLSMFIFDYIVSSIIIALIALMLAVVVMKKKYFRYRTDGLRATRSLQEMVMNVALVALLFPYFLISGAYA
jgi:hypothetical protein